MKSKRAWSSGQQETTDKDGNLVKSIDLFYVSFDRGRPLYITIPEQAHEVSARDWDGPQGPQLEGP